jgi:hypothetical protein
MQRCSAIVGVHTIFSGQGGHGALGSNGPHTRDASVHCLVDHTHPATAALGVGSAIRRSPFVVHTTFKKAARDFRVSCNTPWGLGVQYTSW